MNICINNQDYEFEENTTLYQALVFLQMQHKKGIAVAVNEEIIPQSKWNEIRLNMEDKIIIIGAVAGG